MHNSLQATLDMLPDPSVADQLAALITAASATPHPFILTELKRCRRRLANRLAKPPVPHGRRKGSKNKPKLASVPPTQDKQVQPAALAPRETDKAICKQQMVNPSERQSNSPP